MILLLDCGNTRLKWALKNEKGWLASDALPLADIGRLSELASRWPAPRRILLANVAGPDVATRIVNALGHWPARVEIVKSSAAAAGVTNTYAQPEKLGVDRWCALIGARARKQQHCLIVGAGTATTIDTLDANGVFQGGLILPGLDLMRRALAQDTAALPLAEGHFSATPRRTEDAITSGCLLAQVGAIEHAFLPLAQHPDARCLIFGGSAERLIPHLTIPVEPAERLVLEGLWQLAPTAL